MGGQISSSAITRERLLTPAPDYHEDSVPRHAHPDAPVPGPVRVLLVERTPGADDGPRDGPGRDRLDRVAQRQPGHGHVPRRRAPAGRVRVLRGRAPDDRGGARPPHGRVRDAVEPLAPRRPARGRARGPQRPHRDEPRRPARAERRPARDGLLRADAGRDGGRGPARGPGQRDLHLHGRLGQGEGRDRPVLPRERLRDEAPPGAPVAPRRPARRVRPCARGVPASSWSTCSTSTSPTSGGSAS